jgi:hypothetical protein
MAMQALLKAQGPHAGAAEGAGDTQVVTQTAETTRPAKATKRTFTLASIMADILPSELSTMIPQILP